MPQQAEDTPAATSRDEKIVALFRDRLEPTVRLAFVVTGDLGLAEELAQEAFVRTWRAWGRLRDPDAAAAYIRKTVLNLARSSLRRRALAARQWRRGDGPCEGDPTARLEVIRVLQQLPPRQRACVALRYYEDLSEEETARALGVSRGTVKSQTHKALRRLAVLLGGVG
jgi:RNA polymerase sigma-70 factor (sigma-E family)